MEQKMLEEQNIVNSDDQMYQEIEDVPMVGIIHNHVSEVWSQPRVTKLAS